VVGTVAMIWVGGGIVVHGLAWAGLAQPEHAIHAAAVAAGAAVPAATAFVEWLVGALGASVLGLMAGAVVIPLVSHVIAPAWVRLKRLRQSAPA
jgi:predicted DNA repair protein MutK